MSEALGFVSSVNIYPIKSCQSATVNGEQPRSLGVGLTGFEVEGIVDRQFLICEPNGLFVSQRGQDENKSLIHATDRRLATVQTDIQKDHLNITVNGFGNLQLPTETDAADYLSANIHGNTFWGLREAKEADTFFSRLLGRDVSVIRAAETEVRNVTEKYQRTDNTNRLAAADGAPFLLVNHVTLLRLERVAGITPGTIALNRFRANINTFCRSESNDAITTEDLVATYQIGDEFIADAVSACSRCVIPTIDQKTGEQDSEKLANKAMKTERFGWKKGREDEKAQLFFGANLNHRLKSAGSRVSVGHTVSALSWHEHSLFVPKHAA